MVEHRHAYKIGRRSCTAHEHFLKMITFKILSVLLDLKARPSSNFRSQTNTRLVTAISNKWANNMAGVAVIWKLEPLAAILLLREQWRMLIKLFGPESKEMGLNFYFQRVWGIWNESGGKSKGIKLWWVVSRTLLFGVFYSTASSFTDGHTELVNTSSVLDDVHNPVIYRSPYIESSMYVQVVNSYIYLLVDSWRRILLKKSIIPLGISISNNIFRLLNCVNMQASC